MTCPQRLTFFNDDNPGWTRRRWGRGFRYLDVNAVPLKDPGSLDRIKALVIPPAWHNVWISPLENGHLQCTGKDLKNRKQYIYHPDWTALRQSAKFDKLKDFGERLPKIRKAYHAGLQEKKWTRHKVISLILYLLDNYYFRIGNKQYSESNQTYGLTTLRRKHLIVDDDTFSLAYTAKSGKLRRVKIGDAKAAKLIREISELPGYEIFRYKNGSGNYVNMDSSDVNEYLHTFAGDKFSAKDFRTWGASKLALEEYEPTIQAVKGNSRLKFETTLVKRVAKQMGNTVSVCRKYYIHPEILQYLTENQPVTLANLFIEQAQEKVNGLSQIENIMLTIIRP
ncbi:DNA topoisomerase IB [Fulvivirga sp. M361]|uniref:DNA topoisomerase IB n=1 Tax=Fulvivirga sp. M361 TaxID=2594266 RepID=UPI001179CD80|nr:DNA topoisomerase IB [Fulvivirga sp. M361]TRX60523.1 DNA topoisomerase IB [Fulvivirga sp. M361]